MKHSLFLLLIAIGILIPHFAVVQAITLNLDYPKFGPFDLNVNQSLPEIIGFFYYFIVGISGLAAFVMLVWGGVQWLTSGAIPSQAGEARDKIKNAIIGLLLVLASFLVIQVINPELTIIGGDVLVDPCSDPANAAKCTLKPAVLPAGPGSGSVSVTVDGQPSIQVPFPASTVTVKWSATNMSNPVCTATTDSNPFDGTIVGQWNYPNGTAPISGTASVNLSSAPSDPTTVDFTLSCESGVETIVGAASVLISSGAGTPPTITQFDVTDDNNTTTWLPGGPVGSAPTYTCCGSFPGPTDIPTSSDVRFRWGSTNATQCDGQNKLFGQVSGVSNPGTSKQAIPITSFGPNIFTLRCQGTAVPDAFMEIIVNKIQ